MTKECTTMTMVTNSAYNSNAYLVPSTQQPQENLDLDTDVCTS